MKRATIILLGIAGFALMFAACASAPASTASRASVTGVSSRSGEPSWVRDPYSKYDRQTYIAVVGMASSRDVAEKDAVSNLVAIFGQNIQVDERILTSYREAVSNGVTAIWSENTAVDTAITTSASIETLIGAEIAEVWDDGRNNHYAVALFNKPKAAQLYSGMVNSNIAMIDKLTNIPAGEKNTIDGFARFRFAAMVADVTRPFVNILSVIGAAVPALKPGDDYRLEAANIIKAIPIGIRVENDKAGRIQGAFAKAFSDLGFLSGGNNSRYLLDVNVITAPVALVNNPNKYTRIELKADLRDTRAGTVLLPYDFNTREGRATQEEADNRAYAAAEQTINEGYAALLNNYLSRLLPDK